MVYALREAHAQDASMSFLANVVEVGVFRDANFVGLFMAHGVETKTDDILAEGFRLGKRMAVPSWNQTTCSYCFCEVFPDTVFLPGKVGIPEPSEKRWIETSVLDAILVPGVLFDISGNRIGHGRGHYDRLLAGRRPDTLLVGMAFDWQVSPTSIPHAAHDVPMHTIVTPTRTIHAHSVL